jgi:hypothetical protein
MLTVVKVKKAGGTGEQSKLNMLHRSRFGGVDVSVLATGPKGHEFKPGRDDGRKTGGPRS